MSDRMKFFLGFMILPAISLMTYIATFYYPTDTVVNLVYFTVVGLVCSYGVGLLFCES